VLDHVEQERLRRLVRDLTNDGNLLARGLEIAKRDERRHAPRHRVGADLRVAELVADVPRLAEHREDLVERTRPARPVRADEHLRECGAVLQASRQINRIPAHQGSALALALKVESAGEAAEQPNPQSLVLVAQLLGSLLQELDRTLIDDAGAPARVLVADRRAGEQLCVVLLAADLGCRPERVERVHRVPGPVARLTELEQELAPAKRVLDGQVERGSQPVGSLVECERRNGRPGGAKVVLDAALGAGKGRRLREVVREVRKRASRVVLRPFESLTDL
jgi:hypothetical protein